MKEGTCLFTYDRNTYINIINNLFWKTPSKCNIIIITLLQIWSVAQVFASPNEELASGGRN